MSVYRRFIAPRLSAAGGFSILGAMLCACLPAHAGAVHYSDTLPVSQLRQGMTGYGLTTFHGTTVSRFEVTIIGILKKSNAGHDMILIRMRGGPITERGANLIHGMSGSPIYIDGKIIGAFSMGEEFPKEPIGMVTPIDDMLDAWDPDIPQRPSYFQPAEKPILKAAADQKVGAMSAPGAAAGRFAQALSRPTALHDQIVNLPAPIRVGDRRISQLVLSANAGDTHRSSGSMAVLHRATSLLYVSGLKESNRAWFQKALDQKGYAITVTAGGGGGGSAGAFKSEPLKPGSCFGTMLATGDMTIGGFGTVTYRRGDRMLGFGHPLMGLGALEGAITTAYVVDVFSGIQASKLLPIAGPVVGTLRQDRDFSVSGDIGTTPHLIPFDVTVTDATTHRSKTFHTDLFQHPDLTPQLLSLVAKDAIGRVHDVPGDVMARVTTTVDAAEVGRITRSNLVYDAVDISAPALGDLSDIMAIVSGNPFYPLPIKSAKMTIDISGGHDTATVERIFLKQGRYEPGDMLDIGVVLKPYRQNPVTRSISLRIPSDTPTGRYQLVVRGGTANVIRFGGMVFGGGSGDPQTPPVNVRQMVTQLGQHEANTDMVARLVLNTYSPAVEGERLSQMPPNLSALMRSDRNSGVRLEREEVRVKEKAGYVVSGTQQLIVTIMRKNTQETPGSAQPGLLSSPGGSIPSSLSLPGSSGLSSASLSGDDNAVLTGQKPDPLSLLSLNPEVARWLAALTPAPPDEKKAGAEKEQAVTKTPTATAPPSTGAPAAATDGAVTTPKPATPDISNDKPVGRQMSVWRQSARADFAAGKFAGTGVTTGGELRLSPTLHRLVTSTETYIWSLVADGQGNLYAGTGTTGKILKIDPQGKETVFATLPVVSIQSLLLAKDGSLWAGSGVKGELFHVTPDGKATLIRTLSEKYILGLAQDSKGNLYLGAGGGGTVYKLPMDQQREGKAETKLEPFLKTIADHIMALAIDAQDNLYVGTAPEGSVYKVTPDGKSSVLYDAKENAIMALAVTPNGDVYAATGPKGLVYRIGHDGITTTVFDRAPTFFTALKAAPDGSVYASTVAGVYHLLPSTTDPTQTVVLPLDNPKDVDFLSMTVLPDGSVATGTGNVGEIYTATPHAANETDHRGTFDSVIHDSKLQSRWGTLRWEAKLPTGSHLTVSTRTGDVAEPDATWNDWSPVRKTSGANEGTIASPPARFIQYRLELSAASSEAGAVPTVREVSLDYMSRNQAPRIAFTLPNGGERWSKSQTVRWTASDPDGDTLTYSLFYSTDAGATWKPFPTGVKPAVVPVGEPVKLLSMEEYEKTLDPSMPTFFKQLALDRHRKALEEGGGTTASTREPFRAWDTSAMPDGTYWLKVVTSDQVSNPMDAQTAQAISEPFLICNTPPRISLSGAPLINPDRTVAVQGSASQSLLAVTAVQYRIDGSDWVAAVPKDGLFDSARESFAFVTAPLTSGKHTLEVLAFNAAGNKTIEKRDVIIP